MPKISVVVPTYNVEAYIETSLKSFINQDFDDFDVYVIDDGSPSNEKAIVLPFVERYPGKIHYVRKDNGGYGSVLEYAFKHLTSEYIVICDPDDWLVPHALSTLAKLIDTHHADVVCGARYLTYQDTQQYVYDKMFSSAYVNIRENHAYERSNPDFNHVYLIENAPHAKAFRRELLAGMSFPHKVSNTDALLFYTALFRSKRVVYSSEPLAYYLIDRFGNSVTDVKPKVIDEMNLVHQLILDEATHYTDLSDSFYFQMYMAFYYICDRSDAIAGDDQLVLQKLKETACLLKRLSPHRNQIHRFYRTQNASEWITNFKYELMLNPIIGPLTQSYWFKERLERRHKGTYLQVPQKPLESSYEVLVSVIVPVYNVEKYLAKCLESLRIQTLDSIEILVINDGTKDKSQKIIDEFVAKNPKQFKSFIKPNGGLSDARNFGIDHAQGKYLAFIDSDDWVDSSMMEKLVRRAEITQTDIVACDMEYVYEDETSEASSGGEFCIADVKESPNIIAINNSACNKLYRKELFESVRFEKGIWYEDLATIPKLISISTRIAKVDEPLYKYFQRWNSIVHTQNPKVFDIYVALNSVKTFLIEHKTYSLYKRFLNKMAIIHGADLTTVRIKDFDAERVSYLKKNMILLNQFYPHWIFNENVWKAPLKKRVVFILNRLHLFRLLLWFYDRKGHA